MLPSLIASAAVVILVADEGSESFGAVAVFLNILAVGFIGEFDNMLGKMLVHTDQVISHEQLVNQLAKAPSRALRRPVRWLQNRVHALSLCVAISMEALYMEELILHLNPIFGGSLLGVGDESRPESAPASSGLLVIGLDCPGVPLTLQVTPPARSVPSNGSAPTTRTMPTATRSSSRCRR